MKMSQIHAAIQAALVITVTPNSSGELASRDMVYLDALAAQLGKKLNEAIGIIYNKAQLQWENSKFDANYWVVTLSSFVFNEDKISVQLLFLDGTRGYLLEGYRLFRNGNKLISQQVHVHDRDSLISHIVTDLKAAGTPSSATGFDLNHRLMMVLVCNKKDLFTNISKVGIPNSKTVTIYPYKIPSQPHGWNSRKDPTRGYGGFATSFPILQKFASDKELQHYIDAQMITFRSLRSCQDSDATGHWKSFEWAVYDLDSKEIVCRDDIAKRAMQTMIKDYPALVN
ncbi:hypothetical protein [Ewingella americana]|uniref:Uncharacterized protein n=1 Tax=Ewingella americana TaxID=41202 RepID=A0A502GEG2_9GAMM|nr:hypothetical protein [Ewingella americana]TPG59928.1 hypothetical protein EAH77_15285 [Ewingella americana]